MLSLLWVLVKVNRRQSVRTKNAPRLLGFCLLSVGFRVGLRVGLPLASRPPRLKLFMEVGIPKCAR